jgi:hypothetical protein
LVLLLRAGRAFFPVHCRDSYSLLQRFAQG